MDIIKNRFKFRIRAANCFALKNLKNGQLIPEGSLKNHSYIVPRQYCGNMNLVFSGVHLWGEGGYNFSHV